MLHVGSKSVQHIKPVVMVPIDQEMSVWLQFGSCRSSLCSFCSGGCSKVWLLWETCSQLQETVEGGKDFRCCGCLPETVIN